MLTIDASAGGGGLLRTALPLSVALGVPVRLVNVRVAAPERGLAWPHVRLLQVLSGWTGSDAGAVRLGDTEVVFRPGRIRPAGPVRLDLDDPVRTFERRGIVVRRDYTTAKDVFPGGLPDQGGRSVRGYSVCAPLMSLLPLLPLMGPGASATIRGGTETAGAPFADAVRCALLPALTAQFGVRLTLSVARRGCIGIGGGEVTATAGPEADSRSVPVPVPAGGTAALLYLFGDVGDDVAARWRDDLPRQLPDPLQSSTVRVAYPVPRVQQLFLLGGAWTRDVSVCSEEGLPLSGRQAYERVLSERRFTGHVSRFLLEQLLLWAAVRGEDACWTTERWTGHLDAVATVVRALSGRTVSHRPSGGAVEVRLA
jgi:RNA 3'-terminal phosphate cyclase (ATP)